MTFDQQHQDVNKKILADQYITQFLEAFFHEHCVAPRHRKMQETIAFRVLLKQRFVLCILQQDARNLDYVPLFQARRDAMRYIGKAMQWRPQPWRVLGIGDRIDHPMPVLSLVIM